MEPRSMNFKSITNPTSKIRKKVESTNMGYISGEVELVSFYKKTKVLYV